MCRGGCDHQEVLLTSRQDNGPAVTNEVEKISGHNET